MSLYIRVCMYLVCMSLLVHATEQHSGTNEPQCMRTNLKMPCDHGEGGCRLQDQTKYH